MIAQDNRGVVLVLGHSDDELTSGRLADVVASGLEKAFTVERIAVDNSSAARSVLELRGAERGFAAAVICVSDSSSAERMVWSLAERGVSPWLCSRVLVVLGDNAGLEALPKRLLDKLEFMPIGKRKLVEMVDRIHAITRAPRPVDRLASVFRRAIAQRSPDPLLALTDPLRATAELEPEADDGGRWPNPLWLRWASFGRDPGKNGEP